MNSGFFDQMVADATEKLQFLLPNVECIAWGDLSDRGNACWDPLEFDTEEEAEMDALYLAAVRTAMPYGGNRHQLLMPEVARTLGNRWVTYDWLTKACARLLNGCSFYELSCMVELSHKLRTGGNNWISYGGLTKGWYDHYYSNS